MVFSFFLFLFLIDFKTSQCDAILRPKCSSQSSCIYCTCTNHYTKFEASVGKYSCNGNKCLTQITIKFLGFNIQACDICDTGWNSSSEKFCELDPNSQIAQNTCQQGQYNQGGTCKNCLTNCLSCTTANDCVDCAIGYYFHTGLSTCAQCSQNCVNCQDQAIFCTECSNDRELTLLNTCACITGYYEQNDQCIQCQLPCIKCISQLICQECLTSSLTYLNSHQNCQCQDGYYYQSLSSACQLCELTCKTCTSTSNNCLSCYVQQNRILENNQCVCQDNYFENSMKQCISCQSPEALTIEKCNYANCNDNVWSYGEQCDDGNQQNQDGCFNCQIEQSFYCINLISQPSQCFRCPENCVNCQYQNNKIICTNVYDGYFINDLNDIQKCNEKCKSCINQASNCLECKYVSIKNQCQFCEYKKGYYTDFKNIQCYTKCGDGLVADIEQCDDGNEQNKDGCNQCEIEQSFYCVNLLSQPSQCYRCPENCNSCLQQNNQVLCTNVIDGYFINDLNDIQKCNEKCLNCYNQANNCLECKYLNIKNSSINCQFCEYKQGYYTNFENNMCYTKCGDGLVADVEQCDDGNLQNGDGCDNQCQLEKLYDCRGDICIKQDVPYPIIEANKTDDLFTPIRQTIVSYNQLLNLSQDFNISDQIKVQIIDKDYKKIQSSINITQNLQLNQQNGSNLTFIVECYFNESQDNIQLLINYSNPNQIKNMQSTYQEVQSIQSKLKDVRFINQKIEIITNKTITSTNYLIYYLLGLIFCAILFGGLEIYYNLLDTIQAFSYLYYINIQFPYNLEQFFQNLNFSQLIFLQNYFNIGQLYSNLFGINFENIVQDINLPQKLENEGYTCSSIINFVSLFFVFAASFLIFIFATLQQKYFFREIIRNNILSNDNKYLKLFKKFKAYVKKYMKNYTKSIQADYFYSGILRVFMASANEFSFSLQIGIKEFSLRNKLQIINSFSTILFIFTYVLTTFCSIFIIDQKKYQVKNANFQTKFGSLFEGLAIKQYTLMINPMLIIKKFFFMLLLIQIYDYSIYQVFHLFLVSIFYLTYLITFAPFEENLELKKNIICECQQTISLFLFLILSINKELTLINYNQQLILGWLIISSIFIALATQVVIDSIQQFKLMYHKHTIFKKICDYLSNMLIKNKTSASPNIFAE